MRLGTNCVGGTRWQRSANDKSGRARAASSPAGPAEDALILRLRARDRSSPPTNQNGNGHTTCKPWNESLPMTKRGKTAFNDVLFFQSSKRIGLSSAPTV